MESKYRYNQQAGALNAAMPPAAAPQRARRHETMPGGVPILQQQQQAVPTSITDESSAAAALTTAAFGRELMHNTTVGTQSLAAMPRHLRTALARRPEQRGGTGASGGRDPIATRTWSSMFYYTVEEGQQVLMKRPNGTMEIIVGPRRVRRSDCRFEPMAHYVAHPGEFLIVRFRDGRQEHHAGPANFWFDPRIHLEISREDALQIAAKEAVVVYSDRDREAPGGSAISRRIVYGPEVFVPMPGEWLHTFSWHGSHGGEQGYQKVPNGLVFQKLWLMPDQMYHDVPDVRTADDAVLTIRLMMFFELCDIETMLGATHDPIGDFVNAATSDVVDFTGRHDFDSFKHHTNKLNELSTYEQLVARASQCGYRIHKIVYRGYGAPESLQRMHDEAIESRTRLQLERATQQQEQELEDFKLERQLLRQDRHRNEEAAAVRHRIEVERQQGDAGLALQERQRQFQRAQEALDAEQRRRQQQAQETAERQHLSGLRELGVDLTRLMTQGRADQVIELRGGGAGAQPHLHLQPKPEGA